MIRYCYSVRMQPPGSGVPIIQPVFEAGVEKGLQNIIKCLNVNN